MNATLELFIAIVNASWRGALVILLVAGLRRFFRHWVPGSIWFGAWLTATLPLFAIFALPTAWSPFNLLRPPHTTLSTPGSATSVSADPPPIAIAGDVPRAFAPAVIEPLNTGEIAAIVWALGGAAIIALRVGAALSLGFRIRRGSYAPDARVSEILRACAAELRLRKPVDLVLTDLVSAPAICGVFHPRILFPADLSGQLSDEELRLVLLHELGHCRRKDLWAQLYLCTAEALHWFNPFVWKATRLARTDCEIACDEFVMRRLSRRGPRLYGETLLKLSQLAGKRRPPFAALGIVETQQQIHRRIHMIVAYRPSHLGRFALGGALLIAVTLLGLTRELSAQTTPPAAVTTEAPGGWWKNGDRPASYVVGVDRTETRGGAPSAYVKSTEPRIDGFGGMMQMCSAESFRGKKLRLSGWLKTQDVPGGGHLWFRVDGQRTGESLQFDNMHGRAPVGSTDWTHYSIVLDVPQEATALAYGFFIKGTGQAWVSELKLDEVSADMPATNMKSERYLPSAPVNLGFN